jgi:hypothetical protein
MTITAMSGNGWLCSPVPICRRTDALAAGATISVASNAAWGINALTNHASVAGGGDPGGPHSAGDPTTIQPAP